MGEPGAYSTIIVVEKDRPGKWQRRLLHMDLGLSVDCKSFRTEEVSLMAREPRLIIRLLSARRSCLGCEGREFLTAEGRA